MTAAAPDVGVPGDPGPGIIVKGGSHGLTVEYRELEAAADRLDELVPVLQDLRSGCTGLHLHLHSHRTASALAGQAADGLENPIRGLESSMQGLDEAAGGLRTAAANYLAVEGRVEARLDGLPGTAAALGYWVASGGGPPDRAVLEMLVPSRDGAAINALMQLLAAGRYGQLRPVIVRKVRGNHAPVHLAGTARGLLERSNDLRSREAGVAEILTVDRDGRRVFIVTLPGTQPGSMMVGPNPFDNYGNAEARAQDSQYITAAVAEALRQAGASAEDAVILVGHSQGGMHAVNVGARLAEDGEFDVEMIVTAGAPGGDRDVPGGVKVLHFEHGQDWVPGADGSSNPDTPDRITVTGTAPAPLLPETSGGLGPAHRIGTYLELAEAADASTDPSLTDSLAHLEDIIGPGAVATQQLFQFTRGQPAAPKPDPKPAPKPAAPKPAGAGKPVGFRLRPYPRQAAETTGGSRSVPRPPSTPG